MKVQWSTATLYDFAEDKQTAYLKQTKTGTNTEIARTREVIGSVLQNIQGKIYYKEGCAGLIDTPEKYKQRHGPTVTLPPVPLDPTEPVDNASTIVWRRFTQKEKDILMIKHINRMVRAEAINQFEHRFDNLVNNEGNIPTHHTARQVFDHLKTHGDDEEVRMTEALELDKQIKATTNDIRLEKTCLDTYLKIINSAQPQTQY